MRFFLVVISGLLVASCGSTGVIKMDADKYMVSVKSAKVGFVSAAEEKANAYQEANEFCAQQNKSVETSNLEMRDSGLMRSASATLEFKCVDSL
jgi:hypothetical protein